LNFAEEAPVKKKRHEIDCQRANKKISEQIDQILINICCLTGGNVIGKIYIKYRLHEELSMRPLMMSTASTPIIINMKMPKIVETVYISGIK